MEGTEVCRRIRLTSKLPIIVLSARGNDTDKVHALDLGADDYVTKPFSPEELFARIRVALRRVMNADDTEKGLFRPEILPSITTGDACSAAMSNFGSRQRNLSCSRCWRGTTIAC